MSNAGRRCPRCRSGQMFPERVWAWEGGGQEWRCLQCGHQQADHPPPVAGACADCGGAMDPAWTIANCHGCRAGEAAMRKRVVAV